MVGEEEHVNGIQNHTRVTSASGGTGESGGWNDFLGNGLRAFRWNENGIIGFWDPLQGARGSYVTWPQYDPSHLVAMPRRVKGSTGRLYRYAHPRIRGSIR